MHKILVLSIFQILLIASFANAANYYVDQLNGSRNNTGSESSPFADISSCAPKLNAGDTCWVKNGTYLNDGLLGKDTVGCLGKDSYMPIRSGTSSLPITIRNYPGNTPLIVGNIATYCRNINYIHWIGFNIQGGILITGVDHNTKIYGWRIANNNISVGVSPDRKDNDFSNHSGIFVQDVDGIIISDNKIHHVDSSKVSTITDMGAGIRYYRCSNCVATNNHIYNNTYEGAIDKESGTNNVWRRNIFASNSKRRAIDRAHIILNNQGTNLNTKIFENKFICTVNIPSSYENEVGVRFKIKNIDTKIYNNVFYNCDGIASFGSSSSAEVNLGLNSYNNIFFKVGTRDYYAYSFERWNANEPVYSNYNIFYQVRIRENRYSAPPLGEENLLEHLNLGTWRTKHPNLDPNSFTLNPLFENLTPYDCKLKINSPALGSGLNGLDIGVYPRRDQTVIGPR